MRCVFRLSRLAWVSLLYLIRPLSLILISLVANFMVGLVGLFRLWVGLVWFLVGLGLLFGFGWLFLFGLWVRLVWFFGWLVVLWIYYLELLRQTRIWELGNWVIYCISVSSLVLGNLWENLNNFIILLWFVVSNLYWLLVCSALLVKYSSLSVENACCVLCACFMFLRISTLWVCE